jgi:hypothetical protein
MKHLHRRLERLAKRLTRVPLSPTDIACMTEVERARALAKLVLRSRARGVLSTQQLAGFQALASGPLHSGDALSFLARMRAIREALPAEGRWQP